MGRRISVGRSASAWCGAALLTGCATASAPSPPQARRPTPITVTRENPAGDAREPEDAALTRLLTLPTGTGFDRMRTLMAVLPDAGNWRRVRVIGHPTRMTYRYGDDHYAIAVVDYRPAEAGADTDACLQRFVDSARDVAERYSVDIGPIERGEGRAWRSPDAPGPMPFVRVSGAFTVLFSRHKYLGAIAAYRSWPGTCLVHAFAVRVGTDETLARKVVDRWLAELAPRLQWIRVSAAPPFEDR